MRTRSLLASLVVVFSLSFGAVAARAQSPADQEGETRDAVWKVQSFDFEYNGLSTSYSCGSLRKRLRSILTRMGAHEGIAIRTAGCYDLSDLARVQITMATPVEATPENVRALTQHDARDELIARMRGETLGSAADIERFPAVWRTISFARDKRLRLAPGDCELVQQLSREVFPLMSVRVLDDQLRCSHAFGNYTRPQLIVTALVAAQMDERSARIDGAREVLASNH